MQNLYNATYRGEEREMVPSLRIFWDEDDSLESGCDGVWLDRVRVWG
jgi:hypothetical protein